jgi:hypothetical protein
MNHRSIFAALTLLVPLAAGCAGRTAPFNEMDKAQITVLRLSQPPPPAAPVAATPTGIPGLSIPGLTPEMTQMGNTLLQGAAAALPPGLIPPGLIPGTTAAPTAAPVQPQAPLYKNSFAITAQQNLPEDSLRSEILDILGSESSFTGTPGQCFTPGMAFSMVRPNMPAADVMVSLSCNQVKADGFQWPYKTNGFSPDALSRMAAVYAKLWGPVPAGGV